MVVIARGSEERESESGEGVGALEPGGFDDEVFGVGRD